MTERQTIITRVSVRLIKAIRQHYKYNKGLNGFNANIKIEEILDSDEKMTKIAEKYDYKRLKTAIIKQTLGELEEEMHSKARKKGVSPKKAITEIYKIKQ